MMLITARKLGMSILLATFFLFGNTSATAQSNFAVFGNNDIFNYINTVPGFTATLVTDTQLATPGFLNSFSAFVYTRDGFSFGSTLSAAAAANVKTFVTGNVVLFNSDIADNLISSASEQVLIQNAMNYVIASGAKGYIGEFTGTAAALESNSDGLAALGLTQGSAGPLGFGGGGSDGAMVLTPAGMVSPVTAGVTFPFDSGNIEYGADLSGIDPATILANWDTGAQSAAIMAFAVPEPTTWALIGVCTIGTATYTWRKRRAAIKAGMAKLKV